MRIGLNLLLIILTKPSYSYRQVPTSKDFTHTRALFNLFRNVMSYCNLRECWLQVSLVSVITVMERTQNFRARLYYAAASQPRVFARLLVGNYKIDLQWIWKRVNIEAQTRRRLFSLYQLSLLQALRGSGLCSFTKLQLSWPWELSFR